MLRQQRLHGRQGQLLQIQLRIDSARARHELALGRQQAAFVQAHAQLERQRLLHIVADVVQRQAGILQGALDASARIVEAGAELAQFYLVYFGGPGRGRRVLGRFRFAGGKHGQLLRNRKLSLAIARQVDLGAAGRHGAQVHGMRRQVDLAIRKTQLGQLERRLRTPLHGQIGQGKAGAVDDDGRAGLGLLQAQLQL